jgi:hyperosmotically inducible protein
LILVIGFAAYLWLNGTGRSTFADRTEDRPVGTSGIDVSKARERGAEVGEKAARVAEEIKESVEEAGITSKVKAKMALDDYVRARAIDVTTSGSVVTLNGTVRSRLEHERAVKLAEETDGVTRVIDHLEIAQ